MTSSLPAPRAPQRRQVTVLFLDIAGSTVMTRQLDPEDVLDVMDTALRHFAALVASHGGRVLQYAGDSVLAVFGAERAQEDDPVRAVHAGLDLLAAAGEHAARVTQAHGVAGFGIRVGIHTGDVLLGGGVDEEGTIRGYTVNIAARLEQSAPVGALRISQETWRQVRGVFDAQAQAPLQVKGQDEPLQTFLVTGVRPLAQRDNTRGIDGLQTAFVGRDEELAAALAAYDRCAIGDGLQVVTLLAEAGLGKSRWLRELQCLLDTGDRRAWLLRGNAQASSMQQPYGLLRDLVARRLQIADSDSGEVARERLLAGLQPFFIRDGAEAALRQAELLGQLIGLDFSASPRLATALRDARLLRDGALAALATWLQRGAESNGSPAVLVLDDLQWADDASLDMLELLRARNELPLLLVLAARPALHERRPGWAQGWARHTALVLQPLAAAGRQALLQSLLRRFDDVPAALTTLIDTQAEGNPYYAEELVQMLIEIGAIDTGGSEAGPWRVRPERLAAARVPGTLVGVLQARLDALAAAERRALQAASIVGPVFWDDAVQSLDQGATSALPALQRKALVQARSVSTFDGVREEAFNHHLLHQVTYDTLLKAERRTGHAQAAAWLATRVGDRMAEYLALTADHYERAGDGARAIKWLDRAAAAAEKRFAGSMALSILTRLLAMPEAATDLRRRVAWLTRQTSVADLLSDWPVQAATLAERSQLAETLDDDGLRADVMVGRSLLADRQGRLAEALGLAESALVLAESSDNAVASVLALNQIGWARMLQERAPEAEAHYRRALPFAREAARRMLAPNHDQYEPQVRCGLGAALAAQCDYEGAVAELRSALTLAHERQSPRAACGCHDWMYVVAVKMFDLPLARVHMQALADVARQIGSSFWLAVVPVQAAELALLEGRYEDTLACVQVGAAALERLASLKLLGHLLTMGGAAHAARGEFALARDLLGRAHGAHEKGEMLDAMHENRVAIADCWRAEGDVARASALLEPEMAAIEASAADSTEPGRLMNAWRVLEAAADPRAARLLRLAHEALHRSVARISEPAVSERMLGFTPLHREIAAAWAARAAQKAQEAPGPGGT